MSQTRPFTFKTRGTGGLRAEPEIHTCRSYILSTCKSRCGGKHGVRTAVTSFTHSRRQADSPASTPRRQQQEMQSRKRGQHHLPQTHDSSSGAALCADTVEPGLHGEDKRGALKAPSPGSERPDMMYHRHTGKRGLGDNPTLNDGHGLPTRPHRH